MRVKTMCTRPEAIFDRCLQLSDPLYRAFTGHFLAERASGKPDITLARAVAWVGEQDSGPALQGRWTMSTRIKFGSKLLSAAAEAGIVGTRIDPRPLRAPRIPDDALLYLLHLLRGVDFVGTLLDNPYLASVGLTGDALAARLRTLPGVRYARQGSLIDLEFEHGSLAAWFASRSASPSAWEPTA